MKTPRLLLILIFLPVYISAQPAIVPYLGASGGNFILLGKFNGSTYFESDEDIILVPKIQPSTGPGIVAGLRGPNGFFETYYFISRSGYTTMESGYSGTCTQHLVRLLGVGMYLTGQGNRLRPYYDMEMSVQFTRFEKVAYPIGLPDYPASALYSGLIFGMGGGVQWMLTDWLALDFRVLPEYYMGTDLRVKGRDRYSISRFGNLMLQSTLGLKFYFINSAI